MNAQTSRNIYEKLLCTVMNTYFGEIVLLSMRRKYPRAEYPMKY